MGKQNAREFKRENDALRARMETIERTIAGRERLPSALSGPRAAWLPYVSTGIVGLLAILALGAVVVFDAGGGNKIDVGVCLQFAQSFVKETTR